MQYRGAKNRSRLKIGPGIYVESLPNAPTYLFYASYVEPVVKKRPEASKTILAINHYNDHSQRSQPWHRNV
jgi:hypothetical protein